MIDSTYYVDCVRELNNSDFGNSRWISFQKRNITINGVTREILLPQLEQKPYKIIRFIRWLFSCCFKEPYHLKTAKDLISFLSTSVEILGNAEDKLLIDVAGKVSRILTKLHKRHSKIGSYLSKEKNLLRPIKQRHQEKVRVEQEALQERERIQEAARQEKLRAKREAQQEQERLRKIQLEKEALARKEYAEREAAFQNQIAVLCAGLKLEAGSLDIAFAMDWTKDDPILFDLTYMMDICNSVQALRVERGQLHPDLLNNLISIENITTFTQFICDLIGGITIRDRYNNELTKENTDRLRQMMLAILNTLNSYRNEPNFKETYASVVMQVCFALQNCSNGINTNVEGIYNNLAFPKDGNFGLRIKLALQLFREKILRESIMLCIKESDRPDYYLEHEAASVNYYFGKMGPQFGLPLSISEIDKRYQAYALKEQEALIQALFESRYSPVLILKYLYEIIYNPEDPTIPTKLFETWVETRYSELASRYELLDEGSGRYKPEVLLQFLQELRIISMPA